MATAEASPMMTASHLWMKEEGHAGMKEKIRIDKVNQTASYILVVTKNTADPRT